MRDGPSLPSRVRRAFRLDLGRQRSVEAELDDEIRFHLDARIAELMARGWNRADAEREALARFGPMQESRVQLLETARSRNEVLTMWDRVDAFAQDVRYAIRQLARSPGLTATVVVTFALGIGANATMFGVVDRLLLRPPAFVVSPETVVRFAAGTAGRGFGQKTFNYPAFKAIRDNARGFERVIALKNVTIPLDRGERARDIQGILVSGEYFSTLGVRPALGRFITPDDDIEPTGTPVVVVSHDFWTTHLAGDPHALGKTLQLADRVFTIVGVAPKGFTGLDVSGPDVWAPLTTLAATLAGGPNWITMSAGSWLTIAARMKPGIPPERAAADAMRVVREAAPDAFFAGKDWALTAKPIVATRASDQGVSGSVARLLVAMSAIVLLIACANVANLLLARGLRRRREIAVRLALGVSRGRLVAHLVTESMLLALLGGIVAMFVAYWGAGIVYALLFSDISFQGSLVDVRVLTFTGLVTIATGVLSGLLPALQVTRPDLSSALKSGSREGGGQRSRTRSSLLVVQTALSLILLVGAGLFVRSLSHLNDVRLGVDVDRVIVGSMNVRAVGRSKADADQIFATALERVSAIPGVSVAAGAATVPFGASFGADIAIPGADSLTHANAMWNLVTPAYFRTLGARVLAGRDFQSGDATGDRVTIVNEMFATRYWKGRNPIGACIRIGDDSLPCARVVGVVENVRRQSIFEDSTGFVYLPMPAVLANAAMPMRKIVVRVDRGNPAAMIEPMRLAMQTAGPQLPYADVHLLADDPTVRRELRPFRLGAAMFGVFGALALVLAAVGIYGVVSYDVGQRTREMGVRIALGASAQDVAGMVVVGGVAVALTGALIGIALALLGGKFVAPLLYAQSARDPLVLGGVSIALLVVAAAACVVPALKAVRTDPIVALRSE